MKSAPTHTIQDYERLLERLATLAQALALASDLTAVYRSLLEFVLGSAPCTGLFVALYDAEKQQRRCVYAWSDGREEDATLLPLLPMNESPNSRAVMSGEIVVTDDYQAAVLPTTGVKLGMDLDARVPQSSLAVPMAVMGRVIGAMEIQSVERAAYTSEHVTALRMAAPLAGMATENVRLLQDERRLRQQAENAYRHKAAMLESAFDAIVTIDHQGRVVEFNPAAERMFGYFQRQVTGRPMVDLLLSTALAERGSSETANPLAPGKGAVWIGRVETTAWRRDGTEFPAEVTITPVGLSDPPLFTGFIRDLTERRRVERERESLESQLRQSQKMEAMGTLAGGIAHDFNNILAAILGNAALAREDAGSHSPVVKSIDEIDKAANRARDLVGQILSFSRRQPTSRVPLALPTIVEEAVRLLRSTLSARVAMEWYSSANLPMVLADRTQVLQVLLNLGSNAAHAMAGRSGNIAIAVERVELDETDASRVGDLRPGSYARITFSDTGQGMDRSTQQCIFEPFFTTKPSGEGTGLGLSVVHGIMRTHEGAITVHSERGKGSRFALYFPVAPVLDTATVPKEPMAPIPMTGQRILYIDDDNALVDLFTRQLERRGYRVKGCVDADDALKHLRTDPHGVDLVITDYNMPRMSGVDVARAVRSIRPGLPVIVTSGYITEQLRSQAAEAGIAAIVSKPNTVEELGALLQNLVASIAVRPSPAASSVKTAGP